MINPDLYSLKSLMVFKALYENGTATKAARKLNITQSGVSRSLAQLEENTGLLLFIRQKNRLIKTPEAEELYKEVIRLAFNLDELKHSIIALREFGASRVRIASIPGLAFGYVPELIANILKVHPNLNIYFDVMSSNDVVHAVETGQFDLGFITLSVVNHQLQLDALIKTEAVCILPKSHQLAKNRIIKLSDLSGQHLVIPNQPNIAADQLLETIEKNGIRISGKTESNISSICALVGYGVGISVINPITSQDLSNKNIIVKPFEPKINYSFGLIYKRNWSGNTIIQSIHKLSKGISK